MSEHVRIEAARGTVEARWDVPTAQRTRVGAVPGGIALLMVGGGDGGFDGPADALYPTLAEDANELGWGALRVDFRFHRFPNDVDEGVHDVLAGITWLQGHGYERIGLIGHSFGGAVVIEAAAESPAVHAVVTLASQTGGVRSVAKLAPRPLLCIHGADDRRLHPYNSEMLIAEAGDPCELVILPGARHSLRQAREEVRRRTLQWMVAALQSDMEG